jgi:peptide/nickel transport system substrate-binding protein
VKFSRIVLVVVAAALLVGLTALWRRGDAPPPPATPQRGGQIIVSARSEPRSFNRLAARDQFTDLIALLTQGRLVRVNRATQEIEPWLAESWDVSADGRIYTMHLRPGVTWSDGEPFTSADVVFSLQAIVDPKTQSPFASSLAVSGQPIQAIAIDPQTVRITYPAPFGPGLLLLDSFYIYPKHKLEKALREGTFSNAWTSSTPPSEMVGTGPFVLTAYNPGQRVVIERNSRYWRKAADGGALPYLARVVIEIVPDQNAELLRLTSGNIDLTQTELRPEDYVVVKRAADQGRLTLLNLGVGIDADSFWFCLKPEAKKNDPRFAFVQKAEFRRAISHAVNRQQFAETVFLGAGVPIWGPITPGNKLWHWPDLPKYDYDPEQAKALLRSIGLEDRDGNGVVEDAKGTEAKFTIITQRGISSYERGATILRDDAAKIGVAFEVAPLEVGAVIERLQTSQYDALYFRFLFSNVDPALSKDLWLSSGSAHVWNMNQKTPATEWERRIDTLMLEQASTSDEGRRRELFNEVQRIVAEQAPILYFAAPTFYYAHNTRVRGVEPSILRPPALWNADTISVIGPSSGT